MTKSKICIDEQNTFHSQIDAKNYLKKIVDAGVLFVESTNKNNSYLITINQIDYFSTVREARDQLKKYVDAGILLIKVQRDN